MKILNKLILLCLFLLLIPLVNALPTTTTIPPCNLDSCGNEATTSCCAANTGSYYHTPTSGCTVNYWGALCAFSGRATLTTNNGILSWTDGTLGSGSSISRYFDSYLTYTAKVTGLSGGQYTVNLICPSGGGGGVGGGNVSCFPPCNLDSCGNEATTTCTIPDTGIGTHTPPTASGCKVNYWTIYCSNSGRATLTTNDGSLEWTDGHTGTGISISRYVDSYTTYGAKDIGLSGSEYRISLICPSGGGGGVSCAETFSSLSLSPNPAWAGKKVIATVTGCTNCDGKTVYVGIGQYEVLRCWCTVVGSGCACIFDAPNSFTSGISYTSLPE
jgi:hypothetical protein